MRASEAATTVSGSAGRRWPVAPGIVAAAAGLVVVLALAVGGWYVLLRHAAAVDKLVPQSTDVLMVADLDPSIGQKINLLGLSHKFPNLKNDQALSRQIDDAINQGFKDAGLSFDRDIKPWLGSRVAASVRIGDRTTALLLVDSKDDGKARAALVKLRTSGAGKAMTWSEKTYQGQTISVGKPGDGSQGAVYAYVDHTVLLGDDEALIRDAIDADRGAKGRLVDSSSYKATLSLLPADRLLLVYVDGGRLGQRLKDAIQRGANGAQVPAGSLNQIDAFKSLGFALAAHSNGLAADLQLRLDPAKLDATTRTTLGHHTSLSPVLGRVPSNAYAFFATSGMKQLTQSIANQLASSSPDAKGALDQLGLTGPSGALAQLGDVAAVEMAPDSSPVAGGALILSTNSPGSFDAALQNIAAAAFQSGPLTSGGTVRTRNYGGVDVMAVIAPDLMPTGFTPSWAASGKVGIIGTTPDQVFAIIKAGSAPNAIGANPSYAATLKEVDQDPDTAFYIGIQDAAAAVRQHLPSESQAQYDKDVASNLRPLRAFLLTSRAQPDRLSARLFLEFQ